MPRLEWGAAGERLFELGVDRGVLYLQDGSGVVWNGLVSVAESSSGGESKEYYLDGVKYLNLSSAEEFRASVEAFTYPDEFDEYEGTTEVKNGLFITRQARQSFGLSYRTLLGNDVQGLSHAYKIHLVYNALALPSDRQRYTRAETAEAGLFRWELTTKPPIFSGYTPTSHFIIDSRETPPGLLKMIEDILYGNEIKTSRLPSVDELINLFSTYIPPIVVDPILMVDGGAASRLSTISYDGGTSRTASTITIDGGTA